MRAVSAVSINDKLSSGKSAVRHRSAEYEFTGRIHVINRLFVEISIGNDRLYDLADNILSYLLLRNLGSVLSRNHYRIHSYGLIAVVFHRDLTLSVRSEIIENSLFSYFGEPFRKFMRKRYRKRHIFRRFVARESEHHSLIARSELIESVATVLFFERSVHSESYIRALVVNRRQYSARGRVESELGSVISDFVDSLSDYALNIYVAVRGYFAHNQNESRTSAGFAAHSRFGILFENRVEYGVAYLVAHLIGMTFGYAFGRKK